MPPSRPLCLNTQDGLDARFSARKDVAWLIVENGGEDSIAIKNKDGENIVHRTLQLARKRGGEARWL